MRSLINTKEELISTHALLTTLWDLFLDTSKQTDLLQYLAMVTKLQVSITYMYFNDSHSVKLT